MKDIFVEGHRGYSAKYPENTLISYQALMDLGADGFEFDIWLSRDKIPVLMHDNLCARTCGCAKNLQEMTLSEIKTLDAGFAGKFGSRFAGTPVPTLRELCELVHGSRPDLSLGVEIKEYTEETVDISVPILKEFGLFDRACFYAFDAPTIRYLKTKYGARTMGYPDFLMRRFDPTEGYRYYDEMGVSLSVARSEIGHVYLNKGMPVHLYCADTEQDVRYCLSQPSCSLITANDPLPLMKVLGRL